VKAFQQIFRKMIIMFVVLQGADHLRFHQVAE
jgi:hypothetical protein